jgi:hypothetical protein
LLDPTDAFAVAVLLKIIHTLDVNGARRPGLSGEEDSMFRCHGLPFFHHQNVSL